MEFRDIDGEVFIVRNDYIEAKDQYNMRVGD